MNNLKEIKGTKIRWQYFNLILAIAIFGFGLGTVLSVIDVLEGANFDLAVALSMDNHDTAMFVEFFVCVLYTIVPLVALSLLNRFLFGKTLCVASKEGLYLEDELIEWDRLEGVEYTPTIPSRYVSNPAQFSNATLYTRTSSGLPEAKSIAHFPMYGLRVIRRYSRGTKTRLSKMGIFIFVMPIVIALIYCVIAFFD